MEKEIDKLNAKPANAEVPVTLKKGRLAFIDILRGLAVLWMIETHVVNACLDQSYKWNWFFRSLNLSNGFVAPSFIFCAGAGFWLAIERKADEYRRLGPGLWVYLRRLGFILMIGYALHLPEFSLRKTLQSSPERLLTFYAIDVLQLIVFSLVMALLLLFLLPKLKWLATASIVIWAAVVVATPFVWQTDPLSHMPMPLATLFVRQPISGFPLFPWAGYLFAGIAVTALFRMSAQPQRWCKILIGIGAGVIAYIFVVPVGPLAYGSSSDWWHASSAHALFRTCGVVMLYSLLYLYSEKLNQGLSLFLQRCGQESLYLYVSHLIIVYGSVANWGLSYMCGGRIGPLAVILFVPALTMPLYYTAMLWHECKSKTPKLARHIMVGGVAMFLVAFIFMP